MRAINLLPPEAAEKSQRRRRLFGVAMLGVAYLVALGLIAFWWQAKASDAEDQVAQEEAVVADLNRQIGQLGDAAALNRAYDDGADRVRQVLATDVSWGRLLNDLGRVIVDRVWLTTFNGSVAIDEDEPGKLGDVLMSGNAFGYPDTASWLRVLDSEVWPAIGAGWINTSTLSQLFDGVDAVTFSSAAGLTRAALSERVESRIPEVPQ